MDRKESAQVFKDVVIYHQRSDVPADVVEAMDVALKVFGDEPRMTREKEARLTQLENVLRAILDNAVSVDAGYHGCRYEVDDDVIDEARALLDGEGAPADAGEGQ